MKRDVHITLYNESEHEVLKREMKGELYDKGAGVYLRYAEEHSDLGDTRTTIRLSADEIRVIRSGDVRSEQQFILGKACRSYYDMPQGRMELEVVTDRLQVHIADNKQYIAAEWSYRLFIQGECSGEFRLRLQVQ